jgi:AcrR family transcriptional regulator
VRLEVQQRRLFESAAAVFSRLGYADASAEAISREAGMSKATFYEHFDNKEECAAKRGGGPAYASADDAFAIVGASFELISRQLRTGHPERVCDLQPLIERLILGLLSQPPGDAT